MKPGEKESRSRKRCEVIECYREYEELGVIVKLIRYFCSIEVCSD